MLAARTPDDGVVEAVACGGCRLVRCHVDESFEHVLCGRTRVIRDESLEPHRQLGMLGDRQDVEPEPDIALVVALDEAVDDEQGALLVDGEFSRVEGAAAQVREQIRPVLAVQEYCHDDPHASRRRS